MAEITIPDAELSGQVITWETGHSVTYRSVVDALGKAGLDPSVVRSRLPKNAFSRACKKLDEQRVIRMLDDEGSTMRFQFTKEERSGETFDYSLEAILVLDKQTGQVRCDENPSLAGQAQDAINEAMVAWTAADVTALVQKLFAQNGDLFAIRRQGGAYFVPSRCTEFADKIERFLTALDGSMLRFPVPKGTRKGDQSVREAIRGGLEAMIAEYEKAVEEFTMDTRDSAVTRKIEEIKQLAFKVEVYREYLGSERERLTEACASAKAKLKEKIKAVAAT